MKNIPENFDFASLVGRKVRTNTEWVGIKPGTIGKIVSLYEPFELKHKLGPFKSINIEWEIPTDYGRKLMDGFSPGEFEHLELLPKE